MITYYKQMKENLQLSFDDETYYVSYTTTGNLPKSREKDHYYHLELFEMPERGWRIKPPFEECGCRYFQKHGICIHIKFAEDYHSTLKIGRRHQTISVGRPRSMPRALVPEDTI